MTHFLAFDQFKKPLRLKCLHQNLLGTRHDSNHDRPGAVGEGVSGGTEKHITRPDLEELCEVQRVADGAVVRVYYPLGGS